MTTVLIEIGGVAREARALIEECVPADSQRWADYLAWKRALLDYIEARP